MLKFCSRFSPRLASPYLRLNDECEIKPSIPWFLLAMVLAFVTMSTIQIVWLRTSVQMREQLFDDNVYHR